MKKTENESNEKKSPLKADKNGSWLVWPAKPAAPLFGLAFWVLGIAALLLVVCALIVVFIQVPVEDMLLPPFMHAVRSEAGELTGYNIMVGNGIRMYADRAEVELGDIKTVIYAGIMVAVTVLLTFAPICRFIGEILANLARKNPLAPVNARCVKLIGMTVLIGESLILFVSRFYNYLLVRTFIHGGDNMELSLGLNFTGIVMGLLLLFAGEVYAYALRMVHSNRAAKTVPPAQAAPELPGENPPSLPEQTQDNLES